MPVQDRHGILLADAARLRVGTVDAADIDKADALAESVDVHARQRPALLAERLDAAHRRQNLERPHVHHRGVGMLAKLRLPLEDAHARAVTQQLDRQRQPDRPRSND